RPLDLALRRTVRRRPLRARQARRRSLTMALAAHVYETFVKATPERVWQAITDPEYTRRYFHATAVTSTFEPGSPVRYVMADGSDAVEGVIEEIEANRRLVMTWHVLYDAALAEEPVS